MPSDADNENRLSADSPAQEPAGYFEEPWQARAFAIAILASKQGCFTWSEWSHTLARELQGASATDPRAQERSYFDCWLAALQSLLMEKRALAPQEIQARKQAWRDAYRRTPHGTPVTLTIC